LDGITPEVMAATLALGRVATPPSPVETTHMTYDNRIVNFTGLVTVDTTPSPGVLLVILDVSLRCRGNEAPASCGCVAAQNRFEP
jgi:hypothetical protein